VATQNHQCLPGLQGCAVGTRVCSDCAAALSILTWCAGTESGPACADVCPPSRGTLTWQCCGGGWSSEAGPQLLSGSLHHHGSAELQWHGKTCPGGSVWV